MIEVMATAAGSQITVREFMAMELPRHTQLIDGEVVLNSPKVSHQLALQRILLALMVWTRGGPGRGAAWAELGVPIDERNWYLPDALWTCEERLPQLQRDDALDRVPDLAVEVRSPSTWRYDLGAKRDHYEEKGLPELWLVDPQQQTVLVYRRSEPGLPVFDVKIVLTEADDDTLRSPQLPGFELPLAELFAPLR
jgi:Uma2 family endonuclease